MSTSAPEARQGLIHLYTGDGKGKTTAALGLLLRAYGRGLRVVLAQFLKGRKTGELLVLEKLPGVIVLRESEDFGFYASAPAANRAAMQREDSNNLLEACRLAREGLCDLLVLDEICAAYNNETVDRATVDEFIATKPPALELVMTGRNAPEHFFEAAHYVSELCLKKHPYTLNIAAREGVEF